MANARGAQLLGLQRLCPRSLLEPWLPLVAPVCCGCFVRPSHLASPLCCFERGGKTSFLTWPPPLGYLERLAAWSAFWGALAGTPVFKELKLLCIRMRPPGTCSSRSGSALLSNLISGNIRPLARYLLLALARCCGSGLTV